MVDQARREEMKKYQAERSTFRRSRGIVSKTAWILAAEQEEFRKVTDRFTEHARLVEAVTGGTRMDATEIVRIINTHRLPYDPGDLIFLSRVSEELSIRPTTLPVIERRARAIIEAYQLPVAFEDLL
jgi:hypothetical protein